MIVLIVRKRASIIFEMRIGVFRVSFSIHREARPDKADKVGRRKINVCRMVNCYLADETTSKS